MMTYQWRKASVANSSDIVSGSVLTRSNDGYSRREMAAEKLTKPATSKGVMARRKLLCDGKTGMILTNDVSLIGKHCDGNPHLLILLMTHCYWYWQWYSVIIIEAIDHWLLSTNDDDWPIDWRVDIDIGNCW